MVMTWKIYLDDIRDTPSGYFRVKSVNEARYLIEYLEKTFNLSENYFILDLDHDLGDYASQGGDGIKLIDWLIETGRNTPWYEVHLHTQNVVAKEYMRREIDKYWRK